MRRVQAFQQYSPPLLAALFVSACLGLLVLGPAPARAAALPTTIADGSRIHISPWSGSGNNDNTNQVALGSGHGDNSGHDGFRWTSRGFASLGDSYSAGIGTHLDGRKEESCRLGLGAYPALLHNELTGIDPETKGKNKNKKDGPDKVATFQWLSCTGATTAQVMSSPSSHSSKLWSWISSLWSSSPSGSGTGQIDRLLTDPAVAALDFATLSVGGNDVGFFDVINACIFRFYGYYSGTCEAALLASEALIAEDDASPTSFASRLTVVLLQLLERVRWEKHPQFRIVVTGYARFFNSETDLCDSCSMSVWWHYGNATGTPPNATDTTFLTKGLRRRMNDLVTHTNRKLQGVVNSINSQYVGNSGGPGMAPNTPRILFVDYDAAFAGHRFCEPGVVEPDYQRNDTWFFLVGGTDNDVDIGAMDTERGNAFATLDPSSPLMDPARCRALVSAGGDWGERALCDLVQARAADPGLVPVVDTVQANGNGNGDGRLVAQNSMWYVPTYYGKTFHPRSNGHKAIRDAVYRVWDENGV